MIQDGRQTQQKSVIVKAVLFSKHSNKRVNSEDENPDIFQNKTIKFQTVNQTKSCKLFILCVRPVGTAASA